MKLQNRLVLWKLRTQIHALKHLEHRLTREPSPTNTSPVLAKSAADPAVREKTGPHHALLRRVRHRVIPLLLNLLSTRLTLSWLKNVSKR